MSVLEGFPLVSQLTTMTSDGKPSENSQFDCVPASIGAALLWYLGKHQWDAEINPDKMKDQAYGDAYHGGTAALAYVPFCAALGFRLYAVDSNPADLVAKAHQFLGEGKPVIFTEPDPYVPSSYGWSHVCVFYADAPGELTALDPYIGRPITHSDAEWTNLLLFNELWILDKEETPAMHVPNGWHDDGTTLVDPQGKKVLGGFRDYVLAHEWNPDDLVVLEERQMGSLEDSNPALGAGAQIIFRFTMLAAPSKGGGIIREYIGVELVTQRQNVAKYYQRWQDALKAAQAPADLQKRLDAALARLSSIGIDLNHLQEEVKSPV